VNNIYIPLKVVKVFPLKKDKSAIVRLGYPLREALYLCSQKKCFANVNETGKVETALRKYIERLNKEK